MNHWIFAGLDKNRIINAQSIVLAARNVFDFHGEFYKNRIRLCADTKKAIVYFMKKYTRLTLDEIGTHIGITDHSSVIYLSGAAHDLIEVDSVFKNKIEQIKLDLKL